jgi:DNA-directed RNA polymerase specialized sigma24 family protein
MIVGCDTQAVRLDGPEDVVYAAGDAAPSRAGAMMDVQNSLEALLQRVAKKDRAAFRDLYAATSSRLFAVCLGLLRDRARAEEALQESFTRIWERAGSTTHKKAPRLPG